jgi:malate dehydrogenase
MESQYSIFWEFLFKGPKMYKITVVGAGNVGAAAARNLAEKQLAAQIVLLDVVEGLPRGKALDISQTSGIEDFDTEIIGTNNYKDTSSSEIVIITAGLPRKPGMSRDDLLKANAAIVKESTQKLIEHSPQSIIIVVSNPLDAMCFTTFKTSGFDSSRIIGMAGILDTARFRFFLARELNVSVKDISTMVLGGHGDSMVPLISHTSVSGIPIVQLLTTARISTLIERTRSAGIEIVNYLKTGSAYYAPASAAVEIADSIVKDRKRVLPCSAWLNGEYGLENVFCGVPVKLGKNGIEQVIQMQLAEDELLALRKSGESVKSLIGKLGDI